MAALLLAACGGGDVGPIAPPAVASVNIAAGPATVLVGQSVQLSAATRSASGAPLTGRVVRWNSSNAAVGTVSDAGLFSAVAVGSTTITATSEGASNTATMAVLPVPVASVSLTPTAGTLLVGQSLQLAASPRDSIGGTLSGRDVTWSSSEASRATVSGTGLVTALSVGPVTISASSEGRTGTATLSVLPVPVASVIVSAPSALVQIGQTLQLSAVTRDSAGGALNGRTIAWTSSDPTRASVSGSGVLTALTAGAATITASSEGRSGSVTVTITASQAPILASVSPATLTPGQTATLTGIGFVGSPGTTVSVRGTPATVVSASSTQLTFVVPCVNSGTVAIQASTALGASAPLSAPLTVTARPLSSMM